MAKPSAFIFIVLLHLRAGAFSSFSPISSPRLELPVTELAKGFGLSWEITESLGDFRYVSARSLSACGQLFLG